MDEYPNPFTTSGKKTEKACPGTLAHILNGRIYHNFQSFAASFTSRFVNLSDIFSTPSEPYVCFTYLAVSICILAAAKFRSCEFRNHADPGPIGSQNQAMRAMKHVAEPSMMKRYCQLWRAPLSWNTPYAAVHLEEKRKWRERLTYSTGESTCNSVLAVEKANSNCKIKTRIERREIEYRGWIKASFKETDKKSKSDQLRLKLSAGVGREGEELYLFHG